MHCNAPTWFYRVGKKPFVKGDLAICSHVVDASGQCMSESLMLAFNLNFSSCDSLVGFCKSSHIYMHRYVHTGLQYYGSANIGEISNGAVYSTKGYEGRR